MEMTIEQKRALALASARARAAQAAPVDPSTEEPSTAMDVLKSAGSGLATGAAYALSAPEGIANLAKSGMDFAAQKLLPEGMADTYSNLLGPKADARIASAEQRLTQETGLPILPTPNDLAGKVDAAGYEPQTTAGEYAKTIGEFAPAAVAPGSMARRGVQTVVPALTSETAGQVSEGEWYEPYARVAGALTGALVPGGASRAVTPFPVNAERQRVVDILRDEGVDLTAGQATGSRSLKAIEDELGGNAAGNFIDRQGEQFTSAALRRAGIDAPRATPEVIDHAFDRIGGQFDNLAARNVAQADNQFANDMAAVQDEYHMLANPLQRQVLDDAINGVIETVQRGNGTIPGEVYQSMRSRLDRAARGTGQDVQLRDAFYGVRNALDDAMERAMPVADADAWREARREYRNMLVIEKAATGAGENAALGIISPSALRNATVQQGRRQYARGQGDFGDLARAGEATMRPLPNSGTPIRTAARNMGTAIPAALGAMGGAAVGGPGGGVAGGFLGAALPAATGRAILSRPGRAYLGNQLMAGGAPVNAGQNAVIAALLAGAGAGR